MVIGPLFDATGTDYVYVLVDNCVRILSLGSGEEVAQIIIITIMIIIPERRANVLLSCALTPFTGRLNTFP